MRRWRKDEGDEDILFEDLEDPEEVIGRGRRRYLAPPRKMITHYDLEDDIEDEDTEETNGRFDEIEDRIRAGEYKPKKSDPWNAHVLYNLLKDMGEI